VPNDASGVPSGFSRARTVGFSPQPVAGGGQNDPAAGVDAGGHHVVRREGGGLPDAVAVERRVEVPAGREPQQHRLVAGGGRVPGDHDAAAGGAANACPTSPVEARSGSGTTPSPPPNAMSGVPSAAYRRTSATGVSSAR
jgi:hypothetical protein